MRGMSGRRMPLMLAAAALLAVAGGARAFQDEAVSPAKGHTAVVAQGLATMPPGDAGWRVSRQRVSADTAREDAAPGFVVADSGELLVDDGGNRRTLIRPGEAGFSPVAAQSVAPAAGPDASYYEVDLTGAADAGAPAGEVIYASPSFAAPPGERSLTLLRDVLAVGEAASIGMQDAPALVLALSGTVTVEAADGSSANLDAGNAGSFSGDLVVRGNGAEPSAFVAAIIAPGPDSPVSAAATPGATPVAALGIGAISAVIHACSEGIKPADATPDTCPLDPKAMILDLVAMDGEQPVALGAPPVRDGLPIWTDLAPGRYGVRAVVLADGYDRFYVPNRPGIGGEPQNGFKAAGEQGYLIELTEEKPATRIEIYAMPRGERTREKEKSGSSGSGGGVRDIGGQPDGTPLAEVPDSLSTPVTTKAVARPRLGSVTVRVLSCPDPFESWNPSTCVLAAQPYDVVLFAENGDAYPLANAAEGGAGSWVWDGLPFGSYVVQQPVIAPGSAAYYVPGAQYLETGGYLVTIGEDAPSLVLDIFNLAPAPVAVAPLPDPALAPPVPEIPAPPADALPPVPPVDAAPLPPAEVAPPVEEVPVEPAPVEPAPVDPDTDGDGLPDGYERDISGTNPNLFDSDGDGMSDGDEVNLGYGNPLVPDGGGGGDLVDGADVGGLDSDGDGLLDADEPMYGTDPYIGDTDGDGAWDYDEVAAGTSPVDPSSMP